MSGTEYPIRIQLIENNQINRAGLLCLLEAESGFEMLPHQPCSPECNMGFLQNKPDIIFMVMEPSQHCGLSCIQKIVKKHSESRILVLCMFEDIHTAKRLLDLGAKGVICSHTPPKFLFRAIREVVSGHTYIDTNIAKEIALLGSNHTTPFATLTVREHEIVRMLLNGLNQEDIGKRMFISPHTVANHHSHIMKKLNVSNHIELTKLAIRHNFTSA